MSMTRRHLGLAAASAAALVLSSCDAPLRAPSDGAIAPRIELVRLDSSLQASVVTPTSVTARVFGPKQADVALELKSGNWTGKITGLPEGTYELVIEGRAGGQVQYYGRLGSVGVQRGQTATPTVAYAAAAPAVDIPPLPNTASFSQRIPITTVPSASSYTLEWSTDAGFSPGAGLIARSFTASELPPLIEVTGPGTWHVRARAVLPRLAADEVPWSNAQSWTVAQAAGGDSPAGALATTLVPETPDVITERNLTATKLEDWFDVDAQAGDTLIFETRAARLGNPSKLDTRVTLFRNDATTQVGQNDNGAGTDSRLVIVPTVSDLHKLRVDGVAPNTVGHYELSIEIRRLPAAPTALVDSVLSGTRARLSWTDNANNETGFVIERCTGTSCTPAPVDTVAANSTVHIDSTLTQDADYRWRVRALNNVGRSAPTNTVSANTFGPAAPTGLSATTITASRIDLAWTDVATNELGYQVERCTGAACTTFAKIADLPANSNTYGDSIGLAFNQSYVYRVRAVNNVIQSAYSNVGAANTIPPATPTGLAASVVSGTRIDLAWTDVATTETGYRIERCSGAGCTTFAQIGTTGANATSYQDTGVTVGNDYRYLVRATNAAGAGAPTDTVAASTRVPADPSGVVLTVLRGAIRITWTDNSDNEDKFTLWRCAVADCSVGTPDSFGLPADSTVYVDSTVVKDSTYFYRVEASNTAGASGYSAANSANTLLAAPVTVLTATAVSPTQVDLAWDPSTDQGTGLIVGYKVYRCDGACDPATGAMLDSLSGASVAYSDPTVSAASEYTYAVVPVTAFAETPVAGSTTAFVSTALPTAPSALTGTVLSPTSIQLDWTDNSDDETQFELAQCSGAGCTSFVTVGTTGADITTFLADTLTFDVEYRFLVRAVNTAGPSAWSDTLSIGTTLPAVQTNLRVEVISGDGIRLSWAFDPTRALTQTVERCGYVGTTPCADTDFGPIDLHDTFVRSWDYGGHVPGTYYRFRLRSNNNAGSSAYSEIATILAGAPSAPPTSTTAIATSPTSIHLSWSDQAENETVFRIMRCTGGTCDPLAGVVVDSVPRNVTAFDDATVTTGQLYRYVVIAVNGAGTAPSVAFDGHTIAPDAPGTLSALTVTSTQIALSWSDGGPYETGYVIERCSDGGCSDFVPIDTVPADFVSYNDTGLTANATYRYRVQAINAVAGSAYSNIAEKATDLPATPTALSALAMTATRIDLAWTDNADNELFYIVERCLGSCDSTGTFTEIESALAPNAEAYSDNTASAGVTYSYRVRALNGGGVSPTTNIASATTAAPVAPSGLTASTLSGTLIRLTWTDNASNELNYQVERCASADCPTFSLVRTLPANDSVYVDTVAVDDEYTYRVRAVNNVGPSGYTLEATANTIRPTAASDFTVSTVNSTRIDLTWTDNATNEVGYVLERCTGPGCSAFTLLDTLPPGAADYQDSGIPTETSFTYRLYAYNIAGASNRSGPLTATTITPAQPTGLASVLAAPGRIDLSWTDNADNELQYRIERCVGAGTCATQELMNANAVEVATLAADVEFHADSLLASNTNYFYRIRATNNAGASAYSDIVNRSTSVPAAPSALTARTILATRVNLAWTDNAGNETGYRVERCVGAAPCTVFTSVSTLAANTVTFVDSTVTAAPDVTYRVVAFNGGGGNNSNTASVSTVVPAAPSALIASASGQATVNLSWTDNASTESGFAIERCSGLGCTGFAAVDTVAANATGYADASVAADNVYRYRVRAFGNGSSDWAPIADVATILPNAATALVASAISDTRVDLTWTDNTSTDSLWNETGFEVYRCATVGCTPSVLRATTGRDTSFFADSLLTPGETYTYHVVAVNLAGSAAPSNEASAATTVPAVPTTLRDSTVSATEVFLSWVDNATTETGYEIQRCAGSGCTDFVPVDTAAADAQSIVAGGLTDGILYVFRVRAFNANGFSGFSNAVGAAAGAPIAPADLAGVLVSPTQLDLSWTQAGMPNETAFIVERCAGSGCSGFAVIDSLPTNTVSYQDTGIIVDTLYRYRVRSSNAVGPSPYTAEIAVSTYRPATPASLVATSVSATRVDLTWTDVAVNDTAIVVERCLGTTPCTGFTDIATLAPDATAFTDSTVTVNNWYTYRLRAENLAGASNPTAEEQVGTFIPSDPSGLTATTDSPTEITLNWTDNSDSELRFVIERCDGPACGSFVPLDSVAADVNTYQDVTASLGNAYSYRVIARGGGGSSGPSNVASANTIPAGAVASATGAPLSATTLQLSWAAASNVSTYQIATVTGVDTTLFATASSAVTDTVLTVTTGVVYDFVVRASNNAGSGAYAAAQVAMTPPPAPVNLTVYPLSTSEVTLAWGDTTARETGFEVERSFFSGSFGAYVNVSTLGANVTTDNDVVPAATGRYKYRVRAVNLVGAGAYSNEVDLTLTGPTAPSALTANVTAPGRITLGWADNSNSEQSFSIERSVGNNLAFAQLATVGAGVQAFVDSSGLAINTAYYYRVRAVNNIGASAFTNEASATTTVPAAATAIGTTILSSTSIQVNWAGGSTTGETGWRLYRCVGSGCVDYTLLDGSLPADAATYTDNTVSYGTVYRYQARPYNIAGEPATSPITQRALVLPTVGLSLPIPAGRTAIKVTWPGAGFTWETGFEVQQCAGISCTDFGPLATLAANDTLTISTGLTANGAWYRYRARAVADGNVGPWSGVTQVHTPKELVLGNNLVTTTDAEIAATSNATYYVVSMPAGSPTVELMLGSDPGGSTVNNGSYFLSSRGSPMNIHPGWILGINDDSTCTSFNFTPFDAPSVTCSFTHPGATTDYYLTTYSYAFTNLLLQALPGPTSYAFNNCARTGRIGPSQGNCDSVYAGTSLAGQVTVSDSGFQNFVVPFSGRWQVTAVGAAGVSATPGLSGGRGARIIGEFDLAAGRNLRLAVGQMGEGAASNGNGGGGGGSFVYDVAGLTPLLIAGGGGGTRAAASQNGCDASTTVFGVTGSLYNPTSPCTLKNSGAGLGGIVSSSSWGSGGAGFGGDGANDSPYGIGGKSWANFLVGGLDVSGCGTGVGGFGGGGSGAGCNGGGGGGGYSGGDGGWIAGGGGSLNTGTNTSATAGVGTGHGSIILKYLGPTP